MERAKISIDLKHDKNWVAIDKAVLVLDGLSPTAKLVYMFLQGWNSNYKLSNASLGKKLGLSERSVVRATHELKEFNLYFVNRLGSKSYKGYLGNTHKTAYTAFKRDKQKGDK